MDIDNRVVLFSVLFLLMLILSKAGLRAVASDISAAATEITENMYNNPDITDNPTDELDNINDNSDTDYYEEDNEDGSYTTDIPPEDLEDEENDFMDIEPAEANPNANEPAANMPAANMPAANEPAANEPTANDINIPQGTEIKEAGFLMSAEIINSESIIVYNFDDFKSALANNNQYVNIYLGANITMKIGGIEISPSKKKVLISGINPLNGSGPYTINENNSLDPVYAIRVVSDAGTKEVTMRDINIIGRNYYGAICVYDGVSNVTVTFDNVNYNGPQISYNREGTSRIIGNSSVSITGSNGLSTAHELAEVNALELGGNIVINHYAPVTSGLWLVGSNSYVKILRGANVTWNETGSYMIFQDNIMPAKFIMEEYAKLTINTINGLFYNTSTIYHQFGDVLIGYGAELKIVQQSQSSSSIPIMKVKNSFQILKDASLIIIAQGAPQLIYMTGEADFEAKSPDTLVLYNKTNNLIEWSDPNEHKISILSTFMNYWENPCDLAVLGSFDDSPLYRWRKKNSEDLLVEISIDSSETKKVTSNYSKDDYGVAPSESLLSMQSARILTAGKMLLKLDIITDTSSYISGETEPYAMLKATYNDSEGVLHTVYGYADSGGSFDIGLQGVSSLLEGCRIDVYSSKGYKSVLESTVFIQTPDNRLMFAHVPRYMIFPNTKINAQIRLIHRADDNWNIIIADSRSQGSPWALYARLVSMLSGTLNDRDYMIEDAVVFFDNEGNKKVLSDTDVKITSGEKTANAETLVAWSADRGIMLEVDTLKVYSNINYSTGIEWILVDAP